MAIYNFSFEERMYDYNLDKNIEEYIKDMIEKNFDGDYEKISNYLTDNISEELKEGFVKAANNHRNYSQIIDRVVATPIIQTEVNKEGETVDKRSVGITFGVNVAEPDDFIAVLSVYFELN